MFTFEIFTLGCKVNQYESEAISELLEFRGLIPRHTDEPCDAYIINTCTVTSESDRKCRQIIRRAIKKNPSAYILVTGCLAQTDAQSVGKIRGVDYVCGNTDKTKIVSALTSLIENGRKNPTAVLDVTDMEKAPFEEMCIEKFHRTRAYVKIEDGCESHCTYCIIPSARGKIRSKPLSDVVNEVKRLTDGGCREIVLTGIETASYGRDIGLSLIELLEAVDKIKGVGRIRLGSLDPSIMRSDFIKRISKLNSLAHHFHLSMQSGSDNILRLMKRKYNTKMALEGILALKSAIPDVTLTTDMIVGFPSESDLDFLETLEFSKKAEFLMIHVFPYSKRKGTPAADMENQIDPHIKKYRASQLSSLGDEIRKKLLLEETAKNKTATVLFEDYKDGYAYGHTDNFMEVRVRSERSLHSVLGKVEYIGNCQNIIEAKLIEEII